MKNSKRTTPQTKWDRADQLVKIIEWGKRTEKRDEQLNTQIGKWEKELEALRPSAYSGQRAVDFDQVIDVPRDVVNWDTNE